MNLSVKCIYRLIVVFITNRLPHPWQCWQQQATAKVTADVTAQQWMMVAAMAVAAARVAVMGQGNNIRDGG